ncbi:MAG: BTAD domain-containing putative transcriptional regulator [Aeromicrobium erythreum]
MSQAPDGAATTTRLDVLGPVRLHVSGETVHLSELERGLLAAAAGREWIGGATLEEWLWGDHAPSSARNRVQSLVSGLRRKAPAGMLLTEDSGYRLAPEVAVDLDDWQHALDLARTDLAGTPEGADRLAEHLGRFRGEPLHGAPDTPAVEAERARLVEQRLEVVEAEVAARLAAGQLDGLPTRLARLTAAHPFHEGLQALRVECLGAVGRQREALEAYRETRDRLVDELGVEPSARLQEAHQRVLSGEGPATASRPPAWPAVPVPRTLPRTPPVFVGREDSLARLEQAASRVDAGPVVVAVTGLSGSGTSALATAAGARLAASFPDGTLYLDVSELDPASGAHGATRSFLGMLGVPAAVVPDDPDARTGLYRSVLGERRVLVVLDNVDHHDGRVPADLHQLLPAAPGSLAVVTSRSVPEGLDPTETIRLGSLDDDEARDLLAAVAGADRLKADPEATADLVRLSGGLPLALRLVASRLASRPDLTVRRLVERFDRGGEGTGLGLDASAEAALEAGVLHVWERLPESSRVAAARLAELPLHTVSPWVPQVLLDDDHDAERAVDELVDACLVEPVLREGRLPQYRLHDVVARFVRRQPVAALADDGLERLAATLLGHLVAHHDDLPLQLMPPPPLPDGVPGVAVTTFTSAERRLVVVTELGLATACARALVERGHAAHLAWRLLVACDDARGLELGDDDWAPVVESVRDALGEEPDDLLGTAWLDVLHAWHLQDLVGQSSPALTALGRARRALDHLDALPGTDTRDVRTVGGLVAAYAALSLADRPRTEAELAAVDEVLAARPDPVRTGWSLVVRGELLNDFDDLPACEAVLRRARDVLAPTAERVGYARATTYLSRALARQHRLEDARELADEALAVLAEHGAVRPTTTALDARAEIALALGDVEHALELATIARDRARSSRDAFLHARSQRTRARALADLGRLEDAARLLDECVDLFDGLGRTLSVAATCRELTAVLERLGRDDEAVRARLRESEARWLVDVALPPSIAIRLHPRTG